MLGMLMAKIEPTYSPNSIVWFKLLLIAGVFMFVNALEVYATTKEGLNAKPYSILCSIYNVAANTPDSLYDSTKGEAAKEEIDVINASLAEDSWFEEISKAEDVTKLGDDFKSRYPDYTINWKSWKSAVGKVSGDHPKFPKLPSSATAVRLARIKIGKVEDRVKGIRARIGELAAKADMKEIKQTFSDAIYGGEPQQQETKKFGLDSNNRAPNCGTTASHPAKGAKAGSNLVVDFLCLCQKETSGSNCNGNSACGKECLTTATATEAWDYSSGQPTGVTQTWKELKEGCERSRVLTKSTAVMGTAAIEAFLQSIREPKAHASGVGAIGVLGACGGSSKCAGGCVGKMDGNNGICVAYGADEKQWDTPSGITWLHKIKTGLARLAEAENASNAIFHEVTHLQMLQARAEEIYEEAKSASELEKSNPEKPTQNQSQNQNLVTSADKTSPQEPNAAGAANTRHFTLPWILLI